MEARFISWTPVAPDSSRWARTLALPEPQVNGTLDLRWIEPVLFYNTPGTMLHPVCQSLLHQLGLTLGSQDLTGQVQLRLP